jgi:nucleoside-diphosphate-sugar epimerase
VHADDIASAFTAMLEVERERIHGRAFNVGQSTENYLIRDVAELVKEHVGGTVTYASDAGSDTRNYRVSCDLIAKAVPEFQPQWTVAMGILQLVENYQRYGLTIDALTGQPHQRLKRIRALLDSRRIDDDLRWTQTVSPQSSHS